MADETTHRISPVKIRYLSHHLSAMSTTSPLLAIGLQLVQQSYPNCKPYMISVRRTNGLPQASFRFHLTMDTLALLAMCFPLTGALRTFTFKNNVRAGRTDILPRLQRRGLPFAKSEPSVLVR